MEDSQGGTGKDHSYEVMVTKILGAQNWLTASRKNLCFSTPPKMALLPKTWQATTTACQCTANGFEPPHIELEFQQIVGGSIVHDSRVDFIDECYNPALSRCVSINASFTEFLPWIQVGPQTALEVAILCAVIYV